MIMVPIKPTGFVIKKSLLDYPAFGAVLRQIDTIALTRANPREDLRQVLSEGQRLLQAGVSLVIFPQATRLPEFDPASFHTLGTKLAERADVPLVPIAVKTSFQGNGRWFKDFGKIRPWDGVRVSVSAPISTKPDSRAAHAQVVRTITECLRDWEVAIRQAPPESPAQPTATRQPPINQQPL